MSQEQIWFFIWESTRPSSRSPPYQQGWLTLSEVKKNMSLEKALSSSKAEGKVEDHSFWIHSNSMKAAVQLLSDQSISVTWELYCKSDSVVTIHIRPNQDPSPNTSKATSHHHSLTERRKQSGRRTVSDIFVRPPLSQVTASLDALSLGPVSKLEAENKVTIDLGNGKSETFSKEYLLGWITAEVMTAGKDVSSISVTTVTKNGRPVHISLSHDVWTTSLLRGPWKEDFQNIWNISQGAAYQRNKALGTLRDIPNFEQFSKLFIRDLRCFGRDPRAQKRLNDTNHSFFLGQKYFAPDTVTKILALPMGDVTVKDKLEQLAQRKITREQQNEICAAHDLSPLFEAALGLDWDSVKLEMTGDVVEQILQGNIPKKGFGGQ
ncbi:hypothetical protein BKA65DRAFT_601946 [Rhexocercosporidium sp. MPI-PUGE-AT-0058]|nr:hypothetical protein BKA65DRAFT_601946 [Rhexocercosporidium sp. MPI-PUGE-AT-0058]